MQQRKFLVLALALAVAEPIAAQDTVRAYRVRMGGRAVGSLTETESTVTEDGRTMRRFTSVSMVKMELLGSPIDQRIDQTWMLDPTTRAVLRFESATVVGSSTTKMSGRLVDGAMQLSDGQKLHPDVVVAPDYGWLRTRGPKAAGETVTVDWLVPEVGGVQQVTVALAEDADREIDVLGQKTPVRVYDVHMVALHVEATVAVSLASGELAHYEMSSMETVMERVAADDLERIGRADITDRILAPTNLDIDDSSPLTYVRLRATIETTQDITPASLNVPGQSFEGTVENGLLKGVFEIRTGRSDGSGSPPFPVPAGTFAAEALKPYLAPEEQIQSDDPGIAAEARRLADGATTCFQVVDRLARWAFAEIPYAIPGGGSAKGTFESRAGECGGHSRLLAAMLRSLSIPARTPMGGVYVPLHGGSFGQHMWTEVWLGDTIGWLAVDCTAGQSTYIDATHIRLSDGITQFGPKEIEVLDYEPKPRVVAAAATVARRSDAYPFPVAAPMVYSWIRKGQHLGDEQLTYSKGADGGHVIESSVSLASGAFQEATRTAFGDDGRLLTFHADRTEGPLQSSFDVTMANGKAICVRNNIDGERTDEIAVDASMFVLHNNCGAHFLLPLSRYWPLAEGAEVSVRMFHTEQRSPLTLVLRGGGSESITIGGTEVQARLVQAELAGLSIQLHVDEQGRLLRYHQKQGDVTIELQRL